TPPTNADQQEYALSFIVGDYIFKGHKFSLRLIKVLEQVRAAIGVSSDNELQSVLRDLFATSPTQAEARMARAGTVLLNQIFSPQMQDQFAKLLPNNRPLRMVVKSSERDSHYLPWEWLPSLNPSQLFLSTPEHSVVRQFTPASDAPKEE